MNPLKLALIGECMIELQETSPDVTTQTFGGDTLNTAIYCARLARELPLQVDYVTALGTDTFSTRMIRFWENEGVGSELVLRQPGEMPGLYYIELDHNGERVFHYWRSAAAAKKCFEYPESSVILEKLAAYDAIYLSGVSMAIFNPASRTALLKRLKVLARKNISIYFDCNYRPHLWESAEMAIEIYEQLYRISDIVFLTTEEAEMLFGTTDIENAHHKISGFGCKESVIKDGEKPCTICTGNKIIQVEAEKVKDVIDTTAAGDSFSAVYLVARKFGCSPEDAAKMAHRAAAYVVCHKGAIAPIEKMVITGKNITECSQK